MHFKYKKNKKHNFAKENIDNNLSNDKILSIIFFKLNGLKYICSKELERQLLLHKIINWIIYGISPTIGSILISKKNMDSEILNILISIILFLVPIFHFLLSIQEHDKLALFLQLYIFKIDYLLDIMNTNNINDDFFSFIYTHFITLSNSTPYISKKSIINYLDNFSSKTHIDNIPSICKKYSNNYEFASNNDLEIGLHNLNNYSNNLLDLNDIQLHKEINNDLAHNKNIINNIKIKEDNKVNNKNIDRIREIQNM
jgi:hypothetical protein